jgi:hypothetical protein
MTDTPSTTTVLWWNRFLGWIRDQRSVKWLLQQAIIQQIQDHWYDFFNIVGAMGIALAGAWLGIWVAAQEPATLKLLKDHPEMCFRTWPGGILLFCAILTIVTSIISWAVKPTHNALRARILQLEATLQSSRRDYFSIFDGLLMNLAHEMEFSFEERISLYLIDRSVFIMIGRYSKSPNYKTKGRGQYPKDQGCIGEAWSKGECFLAGTPSYADNKSAYVKKMASYNIDEQTVDSLTMKSRSIAALAIRNRQGDSVEAVIVFESMKSNALNTRQILDKERLLKETKAISKVIALFVETYRALEPNADYATTEGF